MKSPLNALSLALLAALSATTAADACTVLGAGGADDTDCNTVMAEAFVNQATAPAFEEVAGRIFKAHQYDTYSKKMDDTNRAAFLRGLYWAYSRYNSEKSEIELYGEIVHVERQRAKPILFQDGAVESAETSATACNLYATRKWKNVLLHWYGCPADLRAGNVAKIASTIAFSTADDVVYSENYTAADAMKAILSTDPDAVEGGVYAFLAMPKELPTAILPLLDVVRGKIARVETRAAALSGLLVLNDPRVNAVAKGLFADPTTEIGLVNAILASARYPEVRSQIALVIQAGPSKPSFAIALARAKKEKIKESVLPLIDLVNGTTSAENLVAVVDTLGEIGSDRALPKLKSSDFYNHANENVRTSVRAAVAKIEAQVNVALIAKGNAAAIAWSKDIIQYNDGAKRPLVDQILVAYRSKSIPTAAKLAIASFLKAEIASGYHDYAPGLVDEMKATLKAVHP